MQIIKPEWVTKGEQFIGIEENKDVATLNTFWADIGRKGYKNRPDIPWCSAFVGSMLVRSGLSIECNSPYVVENSQYWRKYGEQLLEPCYGCLVVFKYASGGHVGFVVGRDANKNLLVLGGNQNDHVSIAAFKTGAVVDYCYPKDTDVPKQQLIITSKEAIMNTSTR